MFCTKIQQPVVSSHLSNLIHRDTSSYSFMISFTAMDVGTSGLAMSRSIGDWDAGEVGVIPDPLIDILDVKEIKSKIMGSLNETCVGKTEEVEIESATGESKSTGQCGKYTEEDVKIFAVSATDVSSYSNLQLETFSFCRWPYFVDLCVCHIFFSQIGLVRLSTGANRCQSCC